MSFFFFNDTATTEIYTLSLHDALPISGAGLVRAQPQLGDEAPPGRDGVLGGHPARHRSPVRGRPEGLPSERRQLADLRDHGNRRGHVVRRPGEPSVAGDGGAAAGPQRDGHDVVPRRRRHDQPGAGLYGTSGPPPPPPERGPTYPP